jgi:hypothetical protein
LSENFTHCPGAAAPIFDLSVSITTQRRSENPPDN